MRSMARFTAALCAMVLAAGGAQSATLFTFVSGTGKDAGSCNVSAPCRTMQYAVSQTKANGEVHALDATNYGAVSIANSLKLIGVPGAALGEGASGKKIVDIKASAGVVEITGFIIDGSYGSSPLGKYGIYAHSPELTVKNCIIRNVSLHGIEIDAAANGHSLIEDTTITGVGFIGIVMSNTVNALDVVINRVTVKEAGAVGIFINDHANVRVVNSLVAQSKVDGILLNKTSSFLSLQSSNLLANGQYGVHVEAGHAYSAGNNSLIDNGQGKFFGSLTNLGQD